AQTWAASGVQPCLRAHFRIVLRNEARNPPAQFGGTGLRQPAQDTHRGVIHSRKRPEIASESLLLKNCDYGVRVVRAGQVKADGEGQVSSGESSDRARSYGAR